MGFWKKLFSGGADARTPEWASFMSDAEFAAFLITVEEELRARGIDYEMGDGIVWMTPPWNHEPEQFGLLNVAQMCHQAGRENFERVVRGHFESIFAGASDRQATEELSRDFEAALPLLKLRLYMDDTFAGLDTHLVKREVAPGLSAVLCFDLPNTVATVGADAMETWGVGLDDVWETALHNIRAEPGIDRRTMDLQGGAKLGTVVGDSFFTASHLLALEDHLEFRPPMGVLCAVPHRHALLYHPITGPDVILAVNSMIPIAHGMHQEGPGSISPNLYWWRDGRIDVLPSQVGPGKLEFHPTDEFVETVLENIARPN